MGLRVAFKKFIQELNEPRYFEARWGCIQWGKVKDSVTIPAFLYADNNITKIY